MVLDEDLNPRLDIPPDAILEPTRLVATRNH